MTPSEVGRALGETPPFAWKALDRRRNRRGPHLARAVRHPVLELIKGDSLRHPAQLRLVSSGEGHPAYSPRTLPATRADCPTERPCPHVSCRHHMATDETADGVRVLNLPLHLPTCVLDVADEGGRTLEDVAEMLGITTERVRQIEAGAIRKVRIAGGPDLVALAEHHADPAERRGNWDADCFGEAG